MSVVATPIIEPSPRPESDFVKTRTPAQLAWGRFRQSHLALLGVGILIVLVILILFPQITLFLPDIIYGS